MRATNATATAKPATLGALLADVRSRFASAGLATPDLDARVLVSAILGEDARSMIVNAGEAVGKGDVERLEAAVRRRLDGEPVYRIIGSRPFFDLEFKLSTATLEPRPDTEILVEAMIPFVRRCVESKGSCRIADMGTGTGAIGLALLSQTPEATCVGVDISAEALETAAENARLNGLADRFETRRSDWFSAISSGFDVIVANPPYIVSEAIASLDREVRAYDPLLALDGGRDGVEPYRVLAAGAPDHLVPQGVVGIEYGFDQANTVGSIFSASGFTAVSHHRDLAGLDRASVFSLTDPAKLR